MTTDSSRSCVSKSVRYSILLVLAGVVLLAGPVAADWLQWRGPGGLGITQDKNLPEKWSRNSSNIQWTAEIPGNGASSPVVTGDRVILTTAYEGTLRVVSRTLIAVLSFALAGLCLITTVLSRRGKDSAKPGWLVRVDSLFVKTGTLAFVVLAAAMAAAPRTFFPTGQPGGTWLVAGGSALLGVSLAVGWFSPAASRWRLIGGGVLILAAAMHYFLAPPGHYTSPMSIMKRGLTASPGILFAAWYFLCYLATRSRPEVAPRLKAALVAISLLLLSGLIFVPANYLQPRIGLLRVVLCLDLSSGKILWESPVFIAPSERKHEWNSYATPTPCTDGKHIVCHFGAGTVCLDMQGNTRWCHLHPEYSETSRYGCGSSPVMWKDLAILVREGETHSSTGDGRHVPMRPSYITAYEKQTGKVRWQLQPKSSHDSYSTPLLLPEGGITMLVTPTWEAVKAYDAQTGGKLWSHELPMRFIVPTVVHSRNFIAVAGGGHGSVAATHVFRLGEKLRDKPTKLWDTRRGSPGVSSPVACNDMLFMVSDTGIMSCYDLESGKNHWRKRLGGRHYASLLAGDGKIYATSTAGITTVVAAEPEFKELARNDLGEDCYASLAVVDGTFLIRTSKHLVRIGR